MGDRIRQRQFHQCERLAQRRSEILQAASILGERIIVAIFCVVGFSDENAIGFEKAGMVIDMTVSIVANEAVAKPEYRIRPKTGAELLFNLGWSGVAVTRGIKLDDFGS